MANEITVTAADVRILSGQTARAIAAEALAFGDLVYVYSSSGNYPTVKKTVGSAVATALAVGVVVAGDPANPGATTVASGEMCDIALVGARVTGFSSATAGGNVWVSDTAGRLSSVVGTKSGFAGVMLTPTIFLFMPGLYTIST